MAATSRARGRLRWGSGRGLELPLPGSGLAAAEELARVGWGGARLWLRPGMTGALVRGGTRLPLEDLEAWGLPRGRKGARWVRLTPELTAELAYRGFQLSVAWGPAPEPAPAVVLAPVPRVPPVAARFRRPVFTREERPFALLTWGIYTGLLFAALSLASLPLPTAPKPEEVARRFARLIYEAPQAKTRARAEILKRAEKKVEEAPPAPEEKAEPEKPKPKPEEPRAAEPRPEAPAPAPAAPPDPARRREEVRQAVAQKGLLGLLGGRGGASTAAARGTLLEGKGAAQDLDKLLESVDGLRAAPTGGGGSGGSPAGAAVARGLDDAARQVAAAPARAVQLEERAAQVVEAPAEAGLDAVSLKEAIAIVHRTVATYLGGLRYLYNRELRKNPDLEGKLTVSMTIDPEGVVTDARVVETTLDAPELVAGVLERVRKWKFPPVAPRPLTVTYPFVFFPTM